MNAPSPLPLPTERFVRPAVLPVLTQHLEEAAFYWLRRDAAQWSPVMNAEHVARFDQLLDAHLEGIRVAGARALPLAQAALARWLTPDEAFVATYAVVGVPDAAALAEIETLLIANAELARGAAAALLWRGPAASAALMDHWWQHSEPALRRAAIPAAMRHPAVQRDTLLQYGLQDASALVRSRALRCIGEWGVQSYRAQLQAALADEELICRAEAACSLALLGHGEVLADLLPEPANLAALPMRVLAIYSLLSPEPIFAAMLQRCMDEPSCRRALIWSLALRGDPGRLALLSDWLVADGDGRLLAYAISHLTGMDLDLDNLWRPAPEEEGDVATADEGLLYPDVAAVQAWLARNQSRWTGLPRCIAGLPMDLSSMEHLLQHGWQPQRQVAAIWLTAKGQNGLLAQLAKPELSYAR
jgi:uncharacterized protein (TIGR02270 family)